jgi:hypothetical protein
VVVLVCSSQFPNAGRVTWITALGLEEERKRGGEEGGDLFIFNEK